MADVTRGYRLMRAAQIGGVVVVLGLPSLLASVFVLAAGGQARARRFRGRALARTLERLGPAFIKFGQAAGTRRDVLSQEFCDELGRLHDAVRPMSGRDRATALARAGFAPGTFAALGERPVASGSIACVYRGMLADGRAAAVKLKRPGIDRRMRTDLSLVQTVVRACERLPQVKRMPLGDLVRYVSTAILGQLDLAAEAVHTERLRACLRDFGSITVPRVLPGLSGPECIVMEFVDGLRRSAVDDLPSSVRADLTRTLMHAANAMIFGTGLVHCDMHPGNVYLLPPGRIVLLDAGYCVQLPASVQRLIGAFFTSLTAGDGHACAEVMLQCVTAPARPGDAEAFASGITALVHQHAGPDFDFFAFGNGIFELQRDHRLYGAPDFAFPIFAMQTLAGTAAAFAPEVSFTEIGAGSIGAA